MSSPTIQSEFHRKDLLTVFRLVLRDMYVTGDISWAWQNRIYTYDILCYKLSHLRRRIETKKYWLWCVLGGSVSRTHILRSWALWFTANLYHRFQQEDSNLWCRCQKPMPCHLAMLVLYWTSRWKWDSNLCVFTYFTLAKWRYWPG